jgi:hypothetical protein
MGRGLDLGVTLSLKPTKWCHYRIGILHLSVVTIQLHCGLLNTLRFVWALPRGLVRFIESQGDYGQAIII